MRFGAMRYVIYAILFAALGCERSDHFLAKVPDPPPGPPRHSKVYTFDLNSSEVSAVDLDLIWVFDNSGSMEPYRQAVVSNSAQFMHQFTSSTKLHWRMGVLS